VTGHMTFENPSELTQLAKLDRSNTFWHESTISTQMCHSSRR